MDPRLREEDEGVLVDPRIRGDDEEVYMCMYHEIFWHSADDYYRLSMKTRLCGVYSWMQFQMSFLLQS